ncbi:hypothetical protein DFP72DRAFT_853196 [Ephemerocybe angulata]|uniref:Uncharacterized protein n=1 Tax=Ephemerocybe angulata TaxID=980116 RepID=A0A8H6HMA3_9AGAR|nr:hypothetical protein DFP72DRAFT_853196 [Tulosesus angulatus]
MPRVHSSGAKLVLAENRKNWENIKKGQEPGSHSPSINTMDDFPPRLRSQTNSKGLSSEIRRELYGVSRMEVGAGAFFGAVFSWRTYIDCGVLSLAYPGFNLQEKGQLGPNLGSNFDPNFGVFLKGSVFAGVKAPTWSKGCRRETQNHVKSRREVGIKVECKSWSRARFASNLRSWGIFDGPTWLQVGAKLRVKLVRSWPTVKRPIVAQLLNSQARLDRNMKNAVLAFGGSSIFWKKVHEPVKRGADPIQSRKTGRAGYWTAPPSIPADDRELRKYSLPKDCKSCARRQLCGKNCEVIDPSPFVSLKSCQHGTCALTSGSLPVSNRQEAEAASQGPGQGSTGTIGKARFGPIWENVRHRSHQVVGGCSAFHGNVEVGRCSEKGMPPFPAARPPASLARNACFA